MVKYFIALAVLAGFSLPWPWYVILVIIMCLDFAFAVIQGVFDGFKELTKRSVDRAMDEKSALQEMQH